MVPAMGLEPTRQLRHRNLNPGRLPIPPHRHIRQTITGLPAALEDSGFLFTEGTLNFLGLLLSSGALIATGLLTAYGTLFMLGLLGTYGALSTIGLLPGDGTLGDTGFLFTEGTLCVVGFLKMIGRHTQTSRVTDDIWYARYYRITNLLRQ